LTNNRRALYRALGTEVRHGRRTIIWAVAALCLVGGEGAAAAGASTAARPAPVFARAVVLAPLTGTIRIQLPGSYSGFVRLSGRRAVPVGTVVDTTAGTVSLTSANPPPGGTQAGEFFRGIFRVEQSRTSGGLVDLVIRDNVSQTVCASGAAHGAALSPRVLGLLRGVAKGRFRTVGRFSAASVRGTNWGVRDRCDGTLTVVREGVVVVRDFRLRRNIVVRTGQTYLAKAL
jgi:hypothetical protein